MDLFSRGQGWFRKRAQAPVLAWAIFTGDLGPFLSDGCTFFPEGPRRDPDRWAICCYEHDLRFWAGGSKASRKRADERLKACVAERGSDATALLMYLGVRLGRFSPRKIPGKTWGNAWATHGGYRDLSETDVERILQELRQYEVPADIEARFIEALRLDLED